MRMLRWGPWVPSLLFSGAAFFAPALAAAFEGLLLLPDGSPAAGYDVSVVGHSTSVTTDREGRFRIVPDPAVPFRLVAAGPQGEVSLPLDVAELPAGGVLELAIPASFEDSVTVVSGVAPSLEAPPASATVLLGQEYLEQRRPTRLFEALEGVAGASRTDETSSGVPIIRGLGRGRTLILLDGARVTAERRAGPSATFLDPFTLSSVEVARGPGSVAYGSDAFGGVINARSRYPEPGSPSFRFQANKGFGADDEESGAVELAGDVLGGALLGVVHARRAGDAEAGGGEPIPFSSYEDVGGALRYTADTGLGSLRVGLSAVNAYDVGKPASDSDQTRTEYPWEYSRRFNVSLAARPPVGWESLDLGLFVGRYRLVLDRDRAASATAARLLERSDVDSNDASLRAVATRAALGGRLQVGFEGVSRFNLEAITERRTFGAGEEPIAIDRSLSIEDARKLDGALFTTFDRPLGARALISAGLRGDRVETENTGGFFGDRSTEDDALSGYAALTVTPVDDLTATFQVARGFRDPTLSDRYFRGPSGRGFVIGNPDLEPETSIQYDASVRWAVGRGAIALFGYRYDIENLIERFRPASDFLFRNRGEAEIQGLELEAQVPLGGGFTAELGAAVARGEAVDDDEPLDEIAAPNGSATLRWAGERGFAHLRLASYLEDDRPGPTEVERPGFTTLDLGGGWHLSDLFEVRVTGRNLTDRRYRDSADEVASLARGRSFSVGIVGRR